MTRKRAQPERAKTAKRKGPVRRLARRTMRIAGALIASHPSLAGGSAAFLVVFGFVSANAVWYQPGAHPAPIFATRERPHAASVAGQGDRQTVRDAGAGRSVDDVLSDETIAASMRTYRVESRDDTETASIPVPGDADDASVPEQGDPLVLAIQTQLADRDFYDGALDGIPGTKTSAAIEAFQDANGEVLTGAPSMDLLERIEATERTAVAVPRARPNDDAKTVDSILSASAEKASEAVDATGSAVSSELVKRIQTGLHNIAYSDVAIDGIAGSRTRAAILNFQKNYRLPATGEPSRRVLDKLVSIGAL